MSKLNVGEPAVLFSLPNVGGDTVSLGSFHDKNGVAVVFSCNHCPYVLAWEDRLIALQRGFADEGIQFVLINSNDETKVPDDSFEKMKAHAAEKNYPFPYLRDKDQTVARAYFATRTPEVFLFDNEMNLFYHGAPDDNHEDPDAVEQPFLRNAIQSMLSGGQPIAYETEPAGCTIKWKD